MRPSRLKALAFATALTIGLSVPALPQTSPNSATYQQTVPFTQIQSDLVVGSLGGIQGSPSGAASNLWVQGVQGLQAATSGNYLIIKPIASLGQATTLTFPDPGSSTATIALQGGSSTFSSIVLTGTSFNDTVQATAAQGQATTYSIPDSGAATDTFATLKANNTFTGTNTFPTGGIVLKGTSFNGTLKELAGLGQATTYTLPDPSAATDTIATLGATNAFTGVNTFSLTNGIGLLGTSFTGSIKMAAALGQATTLTVEDPGAATGFIPTLASAQTAAGVISRADCATVTGSVFTRNILKVSNLDGSALAAAASAGKFGVSTTATFGSPASLALVTEAANSNTKTDACEFEVTLPPNYKAGSAISVVINGNYILGGGTVGTKSLTVDAFKMAADGTAGSNLGPAAQNLTGSNAAYSFAITPTGLVAGDKLLVQVQVIIQDTGGSNITAVLNDINVQASTQM